jgi:hypothetical protein
MSCAERVSAGQARLGSLWTLQGAHNPLDTAVDRVFGATRRLNEMTQRQSILFDHYAELASGPLRMLA